MKDAACAISCEGLIIEKANVEAMTINAMTRKLPTFFIA
jgi:hypothetical protein